LNFGRKFCRQFRARLPCTLVAIVVRAPPFHQQASRFTSHDIEAISFENTAVVWDVRNRDLRTIRLREHKLRHDLPLRINEARLILAFTATIFLSAKERISWAEARKPKEEHTPHP
jgi:hypothetical protein